MSTDVAANTDLPILPSSEDDSELRCPACDYDLRALQSDRCPECGLLIDRTGLTVSQIPWTHRAQMGRARAFRRTAWLVIRRPSRIAADVACPVNLIDAKRFQRAVVLRAFIPLGVMAGWLYHLTLNNNDRWDFGRPMPISSIPMHWSLGWTMEAMGVLLVAVCLWFYLKAVTGVCSYFFHPRHLTIERQNRAIALSYYACAPLAWMPIPAIFLSAILALQAYTEHPYLFLPQLYWVMGLLIVVSLFMQLAAWWRASLVILKRSTRCGGSRVALMGISLPLIWVLLAPLILGVPPLAYAYVCIVIYSLR